MKTSRLKQFVSFCTIVCLEVAQYSIKRILPGMLKKFWLNSLLFTHHSIVIVSKSFGKVSNVADNSTFESLMQNILLSFSSNLNIYSSMVFVCAWLVFELLNFKIYIYSEKKEMMVWENYAKCLDREYFEELHTIISGESLHFKMLRLLSALYTISHSRS